PAVDAADRSIRQPVASLATAAEQPVTRHPAGGVKHLLWMRPAASAIAGWQAAAPGCPDGAGRDAVLRSTAVCAPARPDQQAPSQPARDWCAAPAIATVRRGRERRC